MRSLRFAGGLVGAVVAYRLAVAVWPDFPRAVDLFLLITVFNALGSAPIVGAVGGMVAGLAADTLAGGPYGLSGFADTIAGYGSAYLAQRLVVRRPTRVLLLFALVSAAQQAILFAVAMLLIPEPGLPGIGWVLVKASSVGVLGMLSVGLRDALRRRLKSWRLRRTAKLR